MASLDDVTEATVSGFLVALREGDADHPPLGSSSAARTVVAVRGFHKFALADGLAATDPASGVKPPTPAKRLPKALPLADVESILEAAGSPGTTLALRDRALLELLYGTGARISEAVGLDVDDLDTVDQTVLLRGKGGKQRIVPVGSYALAAVDAYLVRGPARAGLDRARARRRCSSTPAADGSRGSRPGRCWCGPPSAPASPRTSRPTRCGTRSPRTCSTVAPTYASSRSCSATPR